MSQYFFPVFLAIAAPAFILLFCVIGLFEKTIEQSRFSFMVTVEEEEKNGR